MPHKDQPVDRTAQERQKIVNSGRLHWFHWAVVALSAVATLGAWHFSKQQVESRTEAQYQRAASQVVALVGDRMRKYEEGLWGGVAAIQSRGGEMHLAEWRRFAKSLRIDLRYPGINGIGVIHHVRPADRAAYLQDHQRLRPGFMIRPEHQNPDSLPITYIEPEAINARAVGLDVAHESNRYTAALKARDTGAAQITGPIVLVQDAAKTPGFLFYAPFYTELAHPDVETRRRQFIGMVYAPFVFHKLIEGTLDKTNRQVRIRVADGGDMLYDETNTEAVEHDSSPLFSGRQSLELYGRSWTFDIWTTQSFRAENASGQPTVILLGGFAIDALLLTLFVLLTRANRRAIEFADDATGALRRKTDALQQSNNELESFAYAASHDLKAPLRGISNLTSWIEQDLGDQANDEVKSHTALLHGRVQRMENLLEDLLQYSRAGRDFAEPEEFDVGTELQEVFTLLSPPDDFELKIDGPTPSFQTARAPLHQVFRNLMHNAMKHHDRRAGTISVSVRDHGDLYEFAVRDDGPGIAPEYHGKIFDIFQTLRGRDEVEGSGIGLSIVKRIVGSAGGVIAVDSALDTDRGATFRFTWPKYWGGAQFELRRSA